MNVPLLGNTCFAPQPEVRFVPPWPRGSQFQPYHSRSSDGVPLLAVLFGMAHYKYNSKAYIAITGLIGYLMGAIFSWTGNLAVPILLHAGMNIHGALTFRSLVTHFTTYDLWKYQEIYNAKQNEPLRGKTKSSLF